MTVTMSVDEKPATVVFQAPLESQAEMTPKNNTKKWVVVGVIAVVCTALVVCGFVMVFHFFSHTTSKIIKYHSDFTDDDGGEFSEDMVGHRDTGVIVFKVNTPQGHYDLVYNPKQKLGVAVMTYMSDPVCIVHHLSINATVDRINSLVQDDGRKARVLEYELTSDGKPIGDRSFLPAEARERCDGMDVVWGHQPCSTAGDALHRVKRGGGIVIIIIIRF